jgi:hypothetical protein
MKKILLMIVGAFLLSTSLWAKTIVPLSVNIEEDDQPAGNGNPRTPIEVPLVYIEDYTLSFETNHPDYILTLKDEDGYVVYTTTVFSTDIEVILPSTLSGDYEVNLVMGNWLFTGWINL